MSVLSERAMLATLSIRRWGATRTDKKVTNEVAANHGVEVRRAGKYRKHAINVDAPAYKAIESAVSDIRHRHYFYTLPWAQDGARILTTANFERYSEEMRTLRAKFDIAVRDFVADYPQLKESAKQELNGLYDEADYPTNIASRFGIDVSIMPLPDSSDFRASLADDEITRIRSNIESEIQATTSRAMREPYERLYEHIQRMVTRLSNPEGQFRDSLVTGLGELCQILPGLNLTGDATLEKLRRDAEALIANVDAQTLRDNPSVRADVAAKAREIQDTMGAFMGAMS